MPAKIKPSYDTNRTNLRDVIPLSAPFTIYIEPTRMCNLKCFYCMHSTRGDTNGTLAKTGFKLKHMDTSLYDKIVEGILEFPEQPKRVVFSGLGEPLMNPQLGELARRLRKAGFSGRNDIITNGVALTPETADELVDAGISRFVISVQGLTSEAYKEIAGVAVDIERYIENITYLYKHKKEAEIFIKIIDANLKDDSEKEVFFKMFGSICDTMFVEHLIVMEKQMGDHEGKVDKWLNLNNEPFEPRKVCAPMFYFLQANIDGDIFPCPIPGLQADFSMGNIQESSLCEIWNGNKRNQMLRINLSSGYRTFPVCRDCVCASGIIDPAENLDDCAIELLERLDKGGN